MNIIDQDLAPFYVQDKIQNIVANIYKTSTTWNFKCPICGDSKKNKRKRRGYYYLKTNSYHCFNEGCHANGLNIIAAFNNISYGAVVSDYIKWSKSFKTVPLKMHEPVIPTKIVIPDNWTELNPICIELVTKRKVFEAPFAPRDWKLYYNTESKRLVLPWIEDGEIKYYQERALYKDQVPKYKFPYNMSKYIFGLEHVTNDLPYIYYLEGVLDSSWVLNGVSIGSIEITEEQQIMLDTKFPMHEKVLFTDNQWVDTSSKEKIITMKDIGQKVFLWPKQFTAKDVNDYVTVNDINPFADFNFLAKCTMKLSKAKAILQLDKL